MCVIDEELTIFLHIKEMFNLGALFPLCNHFICPQPWLRGEEEGFLSNSPFCLHIHPLKYAVSLRILKAHTLDHIPSIFASNVVYVKSYDVNHSYL